MDNNSSQMVDALFAAYDRADQPGCAVAVVQAGVPVYLRCFGMASLEYNIPITSTTVFNLASVSKQFTAYAIALLAADGKVDLDEDIHVYLPDVPTFEYKVTLHHLLHHTSGLRDIWAALLFNGSRDEDVITQKDVWEILKCQKQLNFIPGDEHSYSNMGYFLLANVIEKVSGQSLQDFCHERIFSPLGMNHTRWLDQYRLVVQNLASSYRILPEKPGVFVRSIKSSSAPGGGDLLSSIEDLARWDENYYTVHAAGGRLSEILKSRQKLNNGSPISYGMGYVYGEYRGLNFEEHGGFDSGYRTQYTRFPEQHTSIIILANNGEIVPYQISFQIADLVLRDLFPTDSSGGQISLPSGTSDEVPSPESLSSLAGLYYSPVQRRTYWIDSRDGMLWIGFSHAIGMPLVFETPGVAYPMLYPFSHLRWLQPESDGKQQFELQLYNDNPTLYQQVTPVEINEDDLKEFSGTFYSPEAEGFINLEILGGDLKWKAKHQPTASLLPTFPDAFVVDFSSLTGGANAYNLEFERDAQEKIKGFRLHGDRFRHLLFIKINKLPAG